MADAASAAAVRRTGKLLRVLAQLLLDGRDPSLQKRPAPAGCRITHDCPSFLVGIMASLAPD
jgi:hypothetical protein